MSTEYRSEDMAEQATITGWACKKCKRFWGDDERMARYCCATTFPCECGCRYDKGWTKCQQCRDAEKETDWFSSPSVEWDGKFPLGIWDEDTYFWSESDLFFWLAERDVETKGENPLKMLTQQVWLTTCSPNNGSDFVMSEFLCDDLHEDTNLDEDDINRTVNDWIKKNAPFSWTMTGERLCIESVRKRLEEK